MTAIVKEAVINATPEKVFDYVSDLRKHPEWAQHDLQVTQTSTGPAAVGATYSSVAHQFGTQNETQVVTEYQPGKSFAFEAKGSLGTARHAFELSASGNGTRLTKSMEIIKPTLMARVMALMIRSQTRKGLALDLERIKAKVEGAS